MNLHVLGTAGYHPTENRETITQMIPEIGFILDAGTGMYRIKDLISTEELHIFISHLHFDHTIGLTYLTDLLNGTNVRKVTIYGPPNIRSIDGTLFDSDFFPISIPVEYEIKPVTEEFEIDGVMVKTLPLLHRGPTVGYRFNFADFELSYITDTIVDKSYYPLARDADLLIHECNFPSGYEKLASDSMHTDAPSFLKMMEITLARAALATHFNAYSESIVEQTVGELINSNKKVIVAEENGVVRLEKDNVRIVDK